jgi:hypothetical protein
MNTKTVLFVIVSFFLFQRCTPTLDLSVDYPISDDSDTELQIQFDFKRLRKSGSKNLDLTRVWIYKDERLVLDMEKVEYGEEIQHRWNFPAIPEGFKITYPINMDTMPSIKKGDSLRFEFLAGGGYNSWEYKPKS